MVDEARGLGGMLLDDSALFSLCELCSVCGVHAELVIEMVEEGVLQPRGGAPEEWRFTGTAVIRAQKALRMSRDLRVNWPGAALALDLLEELEALRRERRQRWRTAAARRR
jgi:chaperone modulatory protein CbpM